MPGDFDYNGFVDDDDITLLGAFYDPSATPLPAHSPAAVPEPGTVVLFAVAASVWAIAALRRRY